MKTGQAACARSLYLTYAALMLLLALSLGSSYLEIGVMNTVMNLGVAALKAALILWFFMQLNRASGAERVVAAAGFLFLVPLFWLTVVEYATR